MTAVLLITAAVVGVAIVSWGRFGRHAIGQSVEERVARFGAAVQQRAGARGTGGLSTADVTGGVDDSVVNGRPLLTLVGVGGITGCTGSDPVSGPVCSTWALLPDAAAAATDLRGGAAASLLMVAGTDPTDCLVARVPASGAVELLRHSFAAPAVTTCPDARALSAAGVSATADLEDAVSAAIALPAPSGPAGPPVAPRAVKGSVSGSTVQVGWAPATGSGSVPAAALVAPGGPGDVAILVAPVASSSGTDFVDLTPAGVTFAGSASGVAVTLPGTSTSGIYKVKVRVRNSLGYADSNTITVP